jgi:hypothetical protein
MLKASGCPDLAKEPPLRPESLSESRVQYLESYRSVMPEILGQVHHGHPASAELALELVAAGEGTREALVQIDQNL